MGRTSSVAARFIGHAAGAEASGVDSTRCSASGFTSRAAIHGAKPSTNDIRQHVDDTKSEFRQMNQERTKITIESTLATVRLRTKVTQGPGSRAAGIAMAYTLIESDMTGRRNVRTPGRAGHRAAGVLAPQLEHHPDRGRGTDRERPTAVIASYPTAD